ncbi:MAG TPA: thioredoxin domain-containing protein [Lysobacter sp.]
MATLKNPIGADDHIQGDEHAAVTLVEYGDYQCPYCGDAYPLVKQLQEAFAGDLRFVFRNFPISQLHPQALGAAATAEYAASKGRFWEAHDALYENQGDLGVTLYVELIDGLRLDPAELRDALQSGAFDEKIRGDFNGGVRSGVNGTPSFFINGVRFDGADFEEMRGVIAGLIATAAK